MPSPRGEGSESITEGRGSWSASPDPNRTSARSLLRRPGLDVDNCVSVGMTGGSKEISKSSGFSTSSRKRRLSSTESRSALAFAVFSDGAPHWVLKTGAGLVV